MRIVTRCNTADDLVTAFRRHTYREVMAVPTSAPHAPGFRGAFTVALSDGRVMLEGVAEVIEPADWPATAGAPPTGAMLLRFITLAAASRELIARIDMVRTAPRSGPPLPTHIRPRPRPGTVPPASAVLAPTSEAARRASTAPPVDDQGDADCVVYEETPAVASTSASRPMAAAPAPSSSTPHEASASRPLPPSASASRPLPSILSRPAAGASASRPVPAPAAPSSQLSVTASKSRPLPTLPRLPSSASASRPLPAIPAPAKPSASSDSSSSASIPIISPSVTASGFPAASQGPSSPVPATRGMVPATMGSWRKSTILGVPTVPAPAWMLEAPPTEHETATQVHPEVDEPTSIAGSAIAAVPGFDDETLEHRDLSRPPVPDREDPTPTPLPTRVDLMPSRGDPTPLPGRAEPTPTPTPLPGRAEPTPTPTPLPLARRAEPTPTRVELTAVRGEPTPVTRVDARSLAALESGSPDKTDIATRLIVPYGRTALDPSPSDEPATATDWVALPAEPPARRRDPSMLPLPPSARTGAMPQLSADLTEPVGLERRPLTRNRQALLAGGLLALAAIAGVALGVSRCGGARTPAAVADNAADATARDAGGAATAATTAGTDASRTDTAADCHLVVTTSPAGADVLADGRALGPSPIDTTLPCGNHQLTIERPRYQSIQQAIALVAGTPATVTLRLERPVHTLTFTSEPSGATIKASKRTCITPCALEVPGFESIRVQAEMSGYKTAKQTVYPRREEQTVKLKLSAEKRKGRRGR